MKKAVALILALTTLIMNINFALADFSIEYHLSEGLTYIETTGTLDDGKDNHTYVFEYTPSLSTLPIVVWGESQNSRKTLLKMAEPYSENAVAGLNGDFFSFYTGIPLGCVVSQGRFLSSSVGNNALLVMDDGTLQIGNPDIKSTIVCGENEFDFYYNKYPLVYSLYLTDSTYSDSTGSDFDCLEIVLEPDDENLYVNSLTPATVVSMNFDTHDTAIQEGHFVLTVPKTHKSYETFSKLNIGESITVNISGSEPYASALYIIGGGAIIAENGEFVPETVTEYSDRARNARTAVGIREDNTAVFFAVNSKKEGFSSGMSIEEVANTLISMGAKTVLNLDGGGSTTVGVKFHGSDKMEVKNFSSDGYPRAVSNAILFLNTAQPDGVVSNAVLFPNLHFALPYSVIDIDEVFFDSSMTQVEDVLPLKTEYTSLSNGVEIVDGKMRINESGDYERSIFASYQIDEEKVITDTKNFYVPMYLDELTLNAESQVLDVGESTKISFYAEYSGFEAACSAEAFLWRFSENNKETLDEGVLAENDVAKLMSDGTLTITTSDTFVSATLIAEYEGTLAELTVYVGIPDIVLDDFEEEEAVYEGYRSPKGKYLEEGILSYENPIEIPLTPKSFKIMHKGKYTSPAYLSFINSDGEEIKAEYSVTKDYSEVTGWVELEAVLDENIKGAVFLKTAFDSEKQDAVVDDLTISYGFESQMFDDIGTSWAKEYIKSIYDMGLISGYTEDGKTLFAPEREITRAEFAKLVTLYQNYVITEESGTADFSDSDLIPLWAEEYIKAVSENNVMNGRREMDGTLSFAPNSPITRTETMIVISRIMGEETVAELNFSDSDLIDEWAREGIGKVVSSGIITGYPDNTIRPHNNITRAEVAVVFSRLYNYMYPEEIKIEDEVKEDVQPDSLEVCP